MALNVQDDLGEVADANSYIDGAYYVAYMADRGVTIAYSTAEEITKVDADLIQATSYMDNLNKYCGTKLNGRDQTTQFPRADIYDNECFLIEGMPREIKQAECEYAYINQEQGTLQPSESLGGGIKREKKKVDVLEKEVEYFAEGQSGSVISYPIADNKIPQSFICGTISDGEMVMY